MGKDSMISKIPSNSPIDLVQQTLRSHIDKNLVYASLKT